MPYKRNWESRNPGCLIFLLDQSRSMRDPFYDSRYGRKKSKAEVLADILNNFLEELTITNTVPQANLTTLVRPRAEVCVLGYQGYTARPILGGQLAGREFVSLPELQENPLTLETRIQKDIDEIGRETEISIDVPIWIKPVADDGTPMCQALTYACSLASSWATQHPNSYPPVIINVTDGEYNDGNPTSAARALTQVQTSDGHALLFTVHITNLSHPRVDYPAFVHELPNNEYARSLFSISSPIPETSYELLSASLGHQLNPGAKGLIFNGDARSINFMFRFASQRATKPLRLDY